MTQKTGNNTLLGTDRQQLAEIFSPFAQPAYRVTQIYKWLHHHHVSSFQEMTNVPKGFRALLTENFEIFQLDLHLRAVSSDGTIKYLWNLADGRQVESVFIPEKKRTTICISSQVGCALGCHFCATAKMGFLRNLTVAEIIEQVIRVQLDTGVKITNVVYMGMGEPFLNYQRVIDASRILCDPEGLAISARKITISTVGVASMIERFAREQQPFKLAISLHAARQELRRTFMPIAERFDLDALMKSIHLYSELNPKKRITFEYVLLNGVNNAAEDGRDLLRLLSPLKCKLNLIPYNDTGDGFQKPQEQDLAPFLEVLEKAPFTVTVRRNRGNDIAAACGQLFAESENRARTIAVTPG